MVGDGWSAIRDKIGGLIRAVGAWLAVQFYYDQIRLGVIFSQNIIYSSPGSDPPSRIPTLTNRALASPVIL